MILDDSRVTDVSALFTTPMRKRANIGRLALPNDQVEKPRQQLHGSVDE